MSTLALAPLRAQRSGDEPTLEALLDETWAALADGTAVACPVCQGEMGPEYAQHTLAVAGRCKSCGSTLD